MFKTTILVLFGIIISCNIMPQDIKIGRIVMTLRDSTRSNRKVPVDIFYPDYSEKDSSFHIRETGEKLPVICFGHGYLISGIWYEDIYKIIVPEGYIMIFPASESGLFPSHTTLARDMNFALDEIIRLGSDSTFQLYGRIDTMKCLMGHSMGGGSVFLAASQKNDINTAIALAPYDTRPSAVKAASYVRIPTLIFAGGNDHITPPFKHQIPIFNSCASKDKTYILIKGGTHCQMGVSRPQCGKVEGISSRSDTTTISGKEQLAILSGYIVPWLDFYLKGDNKSGNRFDMSISGDRAIEYSQSRPISVGQD